MAKRNYVALQHAKQEKRVAKTQIKNARSYKRSAKKELRVASRKGEDVTNSIAAKRYFAAMDQIRSGKYKKRAAEVDKARSGSWGRAALTGLKSAALGPIGIATGARRGIIGKALAGANRSQRLREKAAKLDAKTYEKGGRKYANGGSLDPAYVYAESPYFAQVEASAPKRRVLPKATLSHAGSGLAGSRSAASASTSKTKSRGTTASGQSYKVKSKNGVVYKTKVDGKKLSRGGCIRRKCK